MWELLCERAARPCDDLLSLLAAEISNRRDEHADLVANCVFFISAGHSTTTTLIAGGVVLLLENPEQLAMLREGCVVASSRGRGAAAVAEPDYDRPEMPS
jgi:cytochrome P450